MSEENPTSPKEPQNQFEEYGVDYLISEALKCPQTVESHIEYPDDYPECVADECVTWPSRPDFKKGEAHEKAQNT